MVSTAWEAAEYNVGGDRENSKSSEPISIKCKGVLAKIIRLGVQGTCVSNSVVSVNQSHDGHDKVDIVNTAAVAACKTWSKFLDEGCNDEKKRLDSNDEEHNTVEVIHHGPSSSLKAKSNSPLG